MHPDILCLSESGMTPPEKGTCFSAVVDKAEGGSVAKKHLKSIVNCLPCYHSEICRVAAGKELVCFTGTVQREIILGLPK